VPTTVVENRELATVQSPAAGSTSHGGAVPPATRVGAAVLWSLPAPSPSMPTDTVKRYLPWVVATALFMEQLDSTIVNTAVPAMAASLHVTPLSLKAVVTSYIISLAVGIPISRWMADRFGTR